MGSYYDGSTVFDYIYIVTKCIILLIITAMCLTLSYSVVFPLFVVLVSNFIENDYSFSKDLFKGMGIKNIVLLLLYSFLIHLILIVYFYSTYVYSGVILSIIKGLNFFVIFEILLSLMYGPKYMYHNNLKLLSSLKQSLILANYKIGLSMLIIIVLYFSSIFLTLTFKINIYMLISILLFVWQFMANKLFGKFVLEQERDD